MQTKKRAKPVKFGKPKEEPIVETAAPVEPPQAAAPAAAPQQSVASPSVEVPQPVVPQSGELVDKLSDVPFETDFGSPSSDAPQQAPAASQPQPVAPVATPEPEPIPFTATSTNPAEPSQPEEPKVDPMQTMAAPIDVSSSSTIPPIGRSNEPIPFNPHETVFNTPPDAGEKKKNPFLYFLIIAFVAFVTGIAFMAGIYYAMPDKNFFAMPSMPSIPGTTQPSPTSAPVAQVTVTPIPSVTLADYTVRVLNGSGVSGQAAKVKASLEAAGFTVSSVGNADRNDVTKTQIVYKKTVSKDALAKLKADLQKTYSLDKETELPTSATQATDIVITIGKDPAK